MRTIWIALSTWQAARHNIGNTLSGLRWTHKSSTGLLIKNQCVHSAFADFFAVGSGALPHRFTVAFDSEL